MSTDEEEPDCVFGECRIGGVGAGCLVAFDKDVEDVAAAGADVAGFECGGYVGVVGQVGGARDGGYFADECCDVYAGVCF